MNINELLHDEEFAKAVENSESLEDIVKLINSKGIEVSADDIQKAMDAAENGELSEDSLESVAGGVVTPVLVGIAIGTYLLSKWGRKKW